MGLGLGRLLILLLLLLRILLLVLSDWTCLDIPIWHPFGRRVVSDEHLVLDVDGALLVMPPASVDLLEQVSLLLTRLVVLVNGVHFAEIYAQVAVLLLILIVFKHCLPFRHWILDVEAY